MKQLLISLFVICYSFQVFCQLMAGDLDYDGPANIKLSYNIDPNSEDWYDTDFFSIKALNSDITVKQRPVDSNFLNKLRKLADSEGYYKLKIDVETSKRRLITYYQYGKAYKLLDSDLFVSIILYLDHNGSALSISHQPKKVSELYVPDPKEITTYILLKNIEQGPVPDTASYIQKLEREREAKERGATQDNRSFLAKYWMYIIPLLVFAVLSGSAGNEGQAPAR